MRKLVEIIPAPPIWMQLQDDKGKNYFEKALCLAMIEEEQEDFTVVNHVMPIFMNEIGVIDISKDLPPNFIKFWFTNPHQASMENMIAGSLSNKNVPRKRIAKALKTAKRNVGKRKKR